MWSNHQGIESHRENSCFNILGVCRLCMLEGCSNMEFIFRSAVSNSIANKIACVTRLSLIEGDGLPAMVCQQCLFQLDVADTFIRRCSQSDKSFRNRLTQGACETESSRLEIPAAISLNAIGALASPHLTSDIVGPDLQATKEQDTDEQATEITAIKLEVEDVSMDNEEEATGAYFEQGNELQEDEFSENFTMDTICIKMEEIDVAEFPDDGTGQNCNSPPTMSNDNARSQYDVIQTLAEVVKYKCSICSLEFTKKCALNNHHKFHLRQEKKAKVSATKRTSILKKRAKDANDIVVVHGLFPDRDHFNLLVNSEMKVQDVDKSPLPETNNGKGKNVAPCFRSQVTLPQQPTNAFKCTLCQLNFPSHRSLAIHRLRSKAHKAVLTSPKTCNRQGDSSTIADQQVKNRRASSNSQKPSKPADDDMSANTLTTDGHESVLQVQPKRNNMLTGTKMFKCSRCSFKFLTKLKRASHICSATDKKERIFQRHLRIRVPRTKSDSNPEPQNHTGQGTHVSPSFQCADVQENTSDNPKTAPVMLSSLPIMLAGQNDFAQDHQKDNLESSLNVLSVTKLIKTDSKALPQPKKKQLKKFKCKICLLEFSLSIQLARHMRLAKGHNTSKDKQHHFMKTGKTKPVKEPKNAENNGHDTAKLSVAKRQSADVAISNVPELSATDLLLEGTSDDPNKAPELLPGLPIILGGHNDVAQDHQKDNLESSLIVLSATKLRKTDLETLAQPKQIELKKFKCKICLVEFSFQIQLARHMRLAKGHNTWKPKGCLKMKTRINEPVKELNTAEIKGHAAEKRSVVKRASNAISKVAELNADDLLLEETTTGKPGEAFAVSLPLSKDQNPITLSSASTDNEVVTHAENHSLVTDSQHFQCASCLLMFTSRLKLARHVCNTISQANGKEGKHGCLSQVLTRTKLKTKSQPTGTSEDSAPSDFHRKTNSCNEKAAVSKKKIVAVLDHTEDHTDDRSPMPIGITKRSGPGTSSRQCRPVPTCALASPPKVLSSDIMNNEPIKRHYKSITVQQQCSPILTDETQDCNGQMANGKGSKKIRVSPVVSDEIQNAIPLPNAVGNNFELCSDERFLGNQELSKIQQDSEGFQNVLNRKLLVQLNRLTLARDEKKKVANDCMLPTRSFCSVTEEDINAKSKINQIVSNSNGCSDSDLKDIKKETVCVSTSKKSMETKEGNKSHAEGCDGQPGVVKYTCNICSSDFVSAFSLGNHNRIHKKEFLRKRFLGKANESDLASTQTIRPSNGSVSVSDIQQDIDISRQKCNAMDDPVNLDKEMQLRKVALSCPVCSAQFSNESDLAKCHKAHKNPTRVRKTRISLADAEGGSSTTAKTLSTPCDGCSQTLLTGNKLKKHNVIHSCRTKPFQNHL